MIILFSVLSLIAFYYINRLTEVVISGKNITLELIAQILPKTHEAIIKEPFHISLEGRAVIFGLLAVAFIWLLYLYHFAFKKHYRKGEEHGSARWGTLKDIKPLTNKDEDKNIHLSDMVKISSEKVENFEADRNKNIIIVGGSGSGKTYSEIKPSLMQLHSSYIVTDPKGTILPDVGEMLKNAGYKIKAFNTIDFSKSLHYNPLAYIKKEKDILKVVNVLIENTNGKGSTGDKFWTDCERLLYTAFIAYMIEKVPESERNIPTMIDMLEACQVGEESFKSPIDVLFELLEEEKPNHLAVKQYKKFKQAAGDTMKSILISCGARLAPFDIDELREITSFDELELDKIGDSKTSLFVIMSDTDSTYSFLIAMIMYQTFNLLCEKADNEYQGTLPVHVRCLFDEFANIGKIPDFERLISTIRSRRISAMLILQSLSQLKSVYKDDAETIIDNCDSFVFLGGKSTSTTEQIAKMIGKETVDTQNINESRGQNSSYSINSGIVGRELIDPAEVGKISREECIVLITGLPPFRDKKYNTSKHKRFGEIVDGGAKYYDIRDREKETKKIDSCYILEEVELDSSLTA